MENRTFLVERYLPGVSVDELVAAATRAGAATAAMAAEGIDVRYLGSTFLPDEETCFCQFEGPSAEAVAQANERAEIPFARIVSALRIAAEANEQAAIPFDRIIEGRARGPRGTELAR